ncbi:hypothetical protein HSBAA_PA_2450 (plasmid) [Vreelandella sulfidaeris]|uniref:Uncharacterized protein n=1 Tax=Vreelandella sulfidaeris TaxID=115553 RepID=A0A455UH66_9GAMM|nr:hypothetical protein HSBAA_PA_2450 [Halomonas sulfidaeris]
MAITSEVNDHAQNTLVTSLFALSLGLVTSATWAAPGHGGGDSGLTESDVDRTISLEAGDMWFDPEELELAAGRWLNLKSPTPAI